MTVARSLLLLTVAFIAADAPAETLYEREFKRLSDQRESDLAAYTQKVNRTYRASLEKLLAGATQAKDYETVAKIVEAMKAFPDAAPADPMAPPGAANSRLEQLLTSHPWLLNGELRFTFAKSGHFSRLIPGKPIEHGTYKVKGDAVSLDWPNGDRHGLVFDEKSGGLTYSCPAWPGVNGKPLTPLP